MCVVVVPIVLLVVVIEVNIARLSERVWSKCLQAVPMSSTAATDVTPPTESDGSAVQPLSGFSEPLSGFSQHQQASNGGFVFGSNLANRVVMSSTLPALEAVTASDIAQANTNIKRELSHENHMA